MLRINQLQRTKINKISQIWNHLIQFLHSSFNLKLIIKYVDEAFFFYIPKNSSLDEENLLILVNKKMERWISLSSCPINYGWKQQKLNCVFIAVLFMALSSFHFMLSEILFATLWLLKLLLSINIKSKLLCKGYEFYMRTSNLAKSDFRVVSLIEMTGT